jgi:exodeoxyribonuclease VII small subunit
MTEPTQPATATTTDGNGAVLENDIGYGEALSELERILEGLESSAVDVDQLSQNVARAAALITQCRARLATVEADVASVVDRLGGPTGTDPTDDPPAVTS